ncbi:MAG: hypothetical protein QOE28_2704 [Solirubrobacteraceae bacterium]|jgi:hypothetical protein|nr:hypothetical protein [Solirubrobacteraceae bacterium]
MDGRGHVIDPHIAFSGEDDDDDDGSTPTRPRPGIAATGSPASALNITRATNSAYILDPGGNNIEVVNHRRS